MNYTTSILTDFAQDLADKVSKLADLGRAGVESGTDIGSILRARLQEEIAKANNRITAMTDEALPLGVIDEIPF